eukprot:5567011-Alexandrium_andersonii.AAC.1
MRNGPTLTPRVPVPAHGAVLTCHWPRLATLRAWAQVGDIARYLQRHNLTVRQYEIRRLPTRPHE